MRYLMAVLIVSVALGGCFGNDDSGADDAPVDRIEGDLELLRQSFVLPSNTTGVAATRVNVVDGVHAVWANASLPFATTFVVPEGATMIRFVADPGQDNTVSVSMSHNDTGRRRCNQQGVVSFSEGFVGERSCSSVAAIDPPGHVWRASASGTATASVRVEFIGTPVEGVAGRLDLSLLSMPDYEVGPFEVLYVNSFDDTRLRVEVALPEGEGPWPTVLSSSPYNMPAGGERPERAMWAYFAHDWVRRGYAVVNADVRGYGESGGCVEVWGYNEQKDQVFLVDWVAQQDWSDGNVGFYGQSYVGTTPVEAAVYAPEALKAIIVIAPVINAYNDWHFGGVPNGENALSPAAYQGTTGTPNEVQYEDPVRFAEGPAGGVCDPTLSARANDPRAIYDDFYIERDFSLKVGDVKAAVLYTQGFEDANVKAAMIPGWFNELTVPKLGVFGHWTHQHPARMDEEVLFMAWLDQYVKGKPMGFEALPDMVVTTEGWERTGDTWPPVEALATSAYPDFADGALSDSPVDGDVVLVMDPSGEASERADTLAVLRSAPLDGMVALAGVPTLETKAVFTGAANAFVGAYLYEERADGSQRLVTWGQFNVAHRYGHDQWQAIEPGEVATFSLPFRPMEIPVQDDSVLRLEIRAVTAEEAVPPHPTGGEMRLLGGADGTRFVMPTLGMDSYLPAPRTALP